MAQTDSTVLYSPTGDRYETSDKSEITRLRTRGYTDTKPTPTEIKAATGEKPPARS